MKTRASHPILKPELNKSLFDNYLTNAQISQDVTLIFPSESICF